MSDPWHTMRRIPFNKGIFFGLSTFAISLAALYCLSRLNYLLFHSLVETFSVIVACGIFMISWNSRRFHENGFFLCLGVASIFVAGSDLFHTLAYKGMGVFVEAGANLPTQLWIAGRFIQVSSFLAAPFFLRRKVRPIMLFSVYLVFSALLLGTVFAGWFPVCFREDTGLTLFKIASEYVICILMVVSLYMLLKIRRSFEPDVLRLMSFAIVTFILAELSFTLYSDVFGFFNMAGHLFKVAGFYFIYRGVIETGFARPFDLLFRDLRQSEKKLRRQSAALEDTNAELEKAISDLETANADLEAFNYSVSHDLRGPLTIISCQCQIIQHLYADRTAPEILEIFATIQDQTIRMNDLIRTLLDFAHLNKTEVKRHQIDLSAMALEVLQTLKNQAPERRINFDITKGLTVDADPDLLKILLVNLLGNAWKYTGKTTGPHIEMNRVAGDSNPTFYIRDNGTGFDPVLAGDLFTPFRRLHAGQEFDGTGIGLATAKRIVERHGGRIWAEGSPGQGATFYFSL